MLKERNINKDRIMNYYKELEAQKAKEKEQELYNQLDEFEKMFVDDVKAEGLNPNDPEFNQMINERAGINKNKVINYLNHINGIDVQNKQQDKQPENKDEHVDNEPQKDDLNKDKKDDSDNLTLEQIKEKISKLKERRKEIDSKIVKVDLNATWNGTPELMEEYTKLGEEINKLSEKLPKEDNSNEKNDKKEKTKEKIKLFDRLKNLLKRKKELKEKSNEKDLDNDDKNINKLGFASVLVISSVTIIIGILLTLIIKLI